MGRTIVNNSQVALGQGCKDAPSILSPKEFRDWKPKSLNVKLASIRDQLQNMPEDERQAVKVNSLLGGTERNGMWNVFNKKL